MRRYIKALAAPIGIAFGLGICKLALVVGVPDSGSVFLGVAWGLITVIAIFLIGYDYL